VELLEGRRAIIRQPHGHQVAVIAGLLLAQDDDIAVIDQGINHRVALHLQGVDLAEVRPAQHTARHLDHVQVGVIELAEVAARQEHRLAGDNLPDQGDQGHVGRLIGAHGILGQRHGSPPPQHADAARLLPRALQPAGLNQLVEIVIHHRRGSDVTGLTDLADRRREAPLIVESLDEQEDVALSLGQLVKTVLLLAGYHGRHLAHQFYELPPV